MYIGLHVKYPLFLSDINGTWVFSTDFSKKYSNIKFNENPSSVSRVVPCGQTGGQSDLTNFLSFAKAHKKCLA